MNLAQHKLQLVVGRAPQSIEHVQIATTRARRGAPVFPAPTLPTLQQLNREVPFTENLRSRVPLR